MPRPNERYFDAFSIAHATWGAIFELAGVPVPLAIGASVLFELVENPMKRAWPSAFADDTPDAWQNSAGDVAAFAAGYALSRATRGTATGRAALVGLGAVTGALWLDAMVQRPPALPASTTALAGMLRRR